MKRIFYLLTFLLCSFHTLLAQSKRTDGPIIENYGFVYEVTNPDFKTDPQTSFKVVFDVDRTFEANDKTNPLIETAARFLNLHAQNGIAKEQMKVALVVHGSAAQDILNDKAYAAKFGINNPNTLLIEALDNAGVDIILCGQTAAHRNVAKENALPQVQFALSAITALIQLQNNNYRLIKF
ncbi:DsrE family protein [Leptobacterium sp. I13]|uniref:DsrE family protein n=1 Tax=Leptobacterium meishanense TaxID=3128904 RepID=UPI0030EF54DB